MDKTIRPKARPQKSKLEQGSSLVPRTRSKARDQELSRGDVEFRTDLETQLWYNPLARLGYDPTKVKTMPQEVGANAMYFPPNSTKKAIERDLARDASLVDPTASGTGRVNPDDTVFFNGTAQSPIIAHELSHRGLEQVLEYYREDPEFFKKTYGENAARKIENIGKNLYRTNEGFTELFDDVNAALNIPSSPRTKTMADTRDTAFSSTQEEFQKYIAKVKPEDRWSHQERRYEAELGLIKAAEDLLKQRGEPPKAEPDYPNFIEKTLGFRFAEGGLTMDEQMNKLFSEGGVNTGNSGVDPVSGNEVPPGSMPSEVRDDIDAKLSGGEYVVPADVLRFFGVAFFEDLRRKAKAGLAEMNTDGRIGGGMPEEESDFPFSVDELQAEEDVAFAEGGFLSNLQQIKNEPIKTQQPTSSFNPDDWSYDSSMYGSSGPTEVKKFKDKNGNVVNVLFINGKPVVDIKALGYTEYTEETPVATGEQVAAPEAPRESGRDREPIAPPTEREPVDPAKNYYNVSAEDLLNPDYKTLKDQQGMGVIAKVGTALLGPGVALGAGAINSFQQAQNLADARARKLIAEERKFDTANLDAIIKDMEKNASGVVKGLDVIGLDGTGIRNQHKKDAGIQPTTPAVSTVQTGGSGSTSGGGGAAAPTTPSTKRESSSDRAPITSPRPVAKPTTTVSTPAGPKTVSSTPTSSPRTYTAPTTQQLRDEKDTKAGVNVGAYNATATNRVGPQARGGLINKSQKVTKPKATRKTKI